MTAYPDNNPKTVFGTAKPPFHFTPPIAEMILGQAMANGGKKYGLMNWRDKTISSSVYYDAARRHLAAWWDGEDIASDSGVHHLGHVMACCALILDGAAQGELNDDRPIPGKFSEVMGRIVAGTDALAQTAVEGETTFADGVWTPPEPMPPRFKVGDRIACTCTPTCSVTGVIKRVGTQYVLEGGRAIGINYAQAMQ